MPKSCEIRHLEATVLDGPLGFARGGERRSGGRWLSQERASGGARQKREHHRSPAGSYPGAQRGEEGGVRALRVFEELPKGHIKPGHHATAAAYDGAASGDGELSFADDHRGKNSGHLQRDALDQELVTNV